MNRPPPRRPTLIDVMVLIAASAVGFAWLREPLPNGFRDILTVIPTYGWYGEIILRGIVMPLARAAGYWLTPFTLALLALRLRGPRPRWRRLLRQPGTVATLAALLTIACELLIILVPSVLGAAWESRGVGFPIACLRRCQALQTSGVFGQSYLFPTPGLVVLVSWIALCLDGRWRGEASWIDRAGRLVGIGWVAAFGLVWGMSLYFAP